MGSSRRCFPGSASMGTPRRCWKLLGSLENSGPEVARFAALEEVLAERRQLVETMLRDIVPADASTVSRAIEYSLHAPAKRVRPVLSLLVTEMLRGDAAAILPAACAVELVHTASLILDDLPSMDNARYRRGRPSCHVQFGEATAILAAFALQNR